MAPLEPWEKVLVKGEEFLTTVHGQRECTACHGGVQSPEKETAHTDLVTNPSEDSQAICGECHTDLAGVFESSLHATQQGYWTVINERSLSEEQPGYAEAHSSLETMFGNHCSSCHTTCGDCHISQPNSVGGGFFDGHLFSETPPMTQSCTACHGSRVGNEYLGKNEEYPGDVHFRQGRMNCVDCHTGHELHGQPADCTSCHSGPEAAQLAPADHRYAGAQTPSCESCHPDVLTGQDGLDMHTVHGAELSCEVCHSITYTSCDGCHVQLSQTSGKPFFETENTYFTFLIGRNTRKSFDRPYDYVLVRHIPISPDSYQFYGENLLPNFNALPTWAYATPHNTQTKAPQAETCNACHGNADLFLTADKVIESELEANQGVIVNEVPASIEEPGTPASGNPAP